MYLHSPVWSHTFHRVSNPLPLYSLPWIGNTQIHSEGEREQEIDTEELRQENWPVNTWEELPFLSQDTWALRTQEA